MSYKGKAVMSGGKGSSEEKTKKRKNRDVLQFFEDAADEVDGSDGSDWSNFFDDDDDFLGDFTADPPKVKSGHEKFDQVPFFPKEEELSGDELEKVLRERYGSGSGFVRYAEADYETKGSVDKSFLIPSIVEPTIWKVKCKVGREKNVVFCLIQKYVDLKVLGTKLQIISTFAVEHIKGFVFVEAEKQSDVTEACYQLADVYCTLVTQVASNEVGQLLNVRRKSNEVKEGTWARVKNGIYRGDLTQVVAVNNERKRATVKLIPRVDMQALMEKYGGGSKLKRPKSSVPTARLISSRELEEFRPLMQYRRDRDTGKVFEFLDGLMLKDGFLFKKVSLDSLAFWDVNPTEDELQKFIPPIHDESDNVEWLSQLYGEKKKCDVKIVSKGGGKGGKGGKGDGSSGSSEQSGFEVHDLVLFGKRDFGMVIGMEKDEKYKVLKQGSEGPITLTFGPKELKYVSIENKFTASDHHMKIISINDAVRMLDGPSKGKQGIVKQIYRGIIFVYDENDLENAYFCSKSKLSEKVKQSNSAGHGKDEGCPSTFEDIPSSPKSPLSPKKPWQMKENSSDDRGDNDIFSVGQSLRIKVGPLKGYLCRVLAVRYSEVTVKLDSKQKVLTVKREHLSEVREKSYGSSMSQDPGLPSSFKPFDLIGGDGGANDWLQGTSGSANGDGWNVGSSNERSTLGAVSSWGSAVKEGTTSTIPDLVNHDTGKEDPNWLTKVDSNQKSDTDTAWGKRSVASASNSWGKAKSSEGNNATPWNISASSSGQASQETSSWNDKATDKANPGSWDKGNHVDDASAWKNLGSCGDAGSSGWGKQKADDVNAVLEKSTGDFIADDSWGKAASGFKITGDNKGWGGDRKVDHLEKNSSDTAWNSAPSGLSSQGHSSWEKGKGVAAEGAFWGKSSETREVSAMDIVDKQTGRLSDNSWERVAEEKNAKSSGGSQGWASTAVGHSSEGNAWSKGGGTSDSSGWRKGGDGSAGGGDGGWQRPGNLECDHGFGSGCAMTSEKDQGFGSGRGSGRGFGRGRDFAGPGRGRSDGRGWGSSRAEGEGQVSWGNSSGGNGGSSWTISKPSGNKSWSQKGEDNATNDPSGDKSWGHGSGGNDGGGGSWGKLRPAEAKTNASEGGSSWGGGGNDQTSLKKGGDWNEKASESNQGGGSWGNSQAVGSSAEGGSSWKKSQLKEEGQNKSSEGGQPWPGVSGNIGGGSGWGN